MANVYRTVAFIVVAVCSLSEEVNSQATCIDIDWADSYGDVCEGYEFNELCTTNGGTGVGWDTLNWGDISEYAASGHDAFSACCACGGGRGHTANDKCIDTEGWASPDGEDCEVHYFYDYCTIDGKPSNGWDESWDLISDYKTNGESAFDACCACGGGVGKIDPNDYDLVKIPEGCVSLDWVNADGEDCDAHHFYEYCTMDGKPGEGWDFPSWGSVWDYAVDGVSAFQACCACGGGEIVVPTSKPTQKPTKKPTKKPTPKPTQKPTKKPTSKPTPKPTPKPLPPTPNPTNQPPIPAYVKVIFGGGEGDLVDCIATASHVTTVKMMPSNPEAVQVEGDVLIAAQCCEMDSNEAGEVCRRHNGDSDNTCVGGYWPDIQPMTFMATLQECALRGQRLCDSNCRSRGCDYNKAPVWTRIPCVPNKPDPTNKPTTVAPTPAPSVATTTTPAPTTAEPTATNMICVDSPRDWQSTDEEDCFIYEYYGYCNADGTHGDLWNMGWGPITDFSVDGISAFDACCACGGGDWIESGGYNGENSKCEDSPDWQSADSEKCAVYSHYKFCTPDGDYGAGWDYEWGDMSEFASISDGLTGFQACCACGGGTVTNFGVGFPTPSPTVTPPKCVNQPGWLSSAGETCDVFRVNDYCLADGSTSTGWVEDWGAIADYPNELGVLASDACCACGGGKPIENVGMVCYGDIPNWADSSGETCEDYATLNYCQYSDDGWDIGDGWEIEWGSITEYVNLELTAFDACCACGGGKYSKKTAKPTAAPSLSPTPSEPPTPSPTPFPTTSAPTPSPTPSPTTSAPTPSPTPSPTTSAPTPSPTTSPSDPPGPCASSPCFHNAQCTATPACDTRRAQREAHIAFNPATRCGQPDESFCMDLMEADPNMCVSYISESCPHICKNCNETMVTLARRFEIQEEFSGDEPADIICTFTCDCPAGTYGNQCEFGSQSPTPSPTPSPTTSAPTPSPTTSAPTPSPTPSPTTSAPTPSPTTSEPTPSPTLSPTTSAPTTPNPTTTPSLSPTASPVPEAKINVEGFFPSRQTFTSSTTFDLTFRVQPLPEQLEEANGMLKLVVLWRAKKPTQAIWSGNVDVNALDGTYSIHVVPDMDDVDLSGFRPINMVAFLTTGSLKAKYSLQMYSSNANNTQYPSSPEDCTDSVVGWVDNRNRACSDYEALQLCNRDTTYGSGWATGQTFEDYASHKVPVSNFFGGEAARWGSVDGETVSATSACCACGGGNHGAPDQIESIRPDPIFTKDGFEVFDNIDTAETCVALEVGKSKPRCGASRDDGLTCCPGLKCVKMGSGRNKCVVVSRTKIERGGTCTNNNQCKSKRCNKTHWSCR